MGKMLPHQNTALLTLFPDEPQSASRYQQILERRQSLALSLIGFEENSDFGRAIAPLFDLSDYLFNQIIRFPQWLDTWPRFITFNKDGTVQLQRSELMAKTPQQWLLDTRFSDLDEKALMAMLRQWRNEWMCRLIFLDFLHAIELQDLTGLLSELADTCVQLSLGWLEKYYESLYGYAIDEQGQKQSLIVIGMGKLGGGELNLSSDIDLIFAFREHGETVGGKKAISHQEYFTKIGQKLIQQLDQITLDGFVFRVDMRLRPYGQSGALVTNIDSLENYYQDQGRDWERYAMIKARVMAGNADDISAFESLRRPFVYRKYLDFSVISALRDLKQMIAKEVQRKGIEHNVKLGQGGIREIEFIAQALQILHGGRDSGLQTQSIYIVLPYLQKQGYLSAEQVNELWQAYVFLRHTEHALQAINDEQTHLLPEDQNTKNKLVIILGYSSWQDFEKDLKGHRDLVSQHFSELIEEDDSIDENVTEREAWRLFINTKLTLGETSSIGQAEEKDEIAQLTCQINWQDADVINQRITLFLRSKSVAYMQPIGRERLAIFFADLIKALQVESTPDIVLIRTLPILDAILRRTAYLVLLVENPTAIAHLIQLNRESTWFSEMIAKMPSLLDELLDANTLFLPPDKNIMQDEIRQTLLRLPEEDDEAHMDALRRFRHSMILRIAACDITGVLPLMKVSDHLTWLAEVILDQVLYKAWHHLTSRHGFPLHNGNIVNEPEIVLVGYGKSGGLELGYDSDLDLVFLHSADISSYTNGERSIDNLTFYTRLGQRIIHILTTFTACGRLYEVDMRLRPSGNSGLLVTSLDSFIDYQNKEAWTWEHQALTRARVLSGSVSLSESFTQARQTILSLTRDQATLKTEVIKMREKMRAHLDTAKNSDDFDLKQGEGGIIDIEFMVQYLVLAWSHAYPELTVYSDNIRQMEMAVKTGVLSEVDADVMSNIYKVYRAQSHRLTLQEKARVISKELLQNDQNQITKIWLNFAE